MNLRPNTFNKRSEPIRIPHHTSNAIPLLAEQLSAFMPAQYARPIIFVCIGTDRSTGDCLGPLIGSLLKEKGLSHFHVYGTLDDPIHAVNLNEQISFIDKQFQNPFIVGIDACLGKLKNVGCITIGEGPVKPGAGVQKELTPVGDIHMTGIVNVSGFMEFFVLQNTRLNLVMKMAKTVAESIKAVEIKRIRRESLLSDAKERTTFN